jgi:hypothetical protein
MAVTCTGYLVHPHWFIEKNCIDSTVRNERNAGMTIPPFRVYIEAI